MGFEHARYTAMGSGYEIFSNETYGLPLYFFKFVYMFLEVGVPYSCGIFHTR